jgi:CSLREA domain-containing protein
MMKRTIWLGAVLALWLGTGPLVIAQAAGVGSVITVTTTADALAADGLCSLREAIIAANTDEAVAGCPAGSGADTIVFSPALPSPVIFALTIPGVNEDAGLTGDLDISGTLIVAGAGPDKTIVDGNGIDRVFHVLLGARATLTGLTIRNGDPGGGADGGGIKVLGSLTLSNSSVDSNRGGGISSNDGGVVLGDVRVTNNTDGFGILNQNLAVLKFTGGLVSGNQGGGISNAASSATLSNLYIADNTSGGGVRNEGSTLAHLTLSNSTVAGNAAASGGGILNAGVGAVVDIYNTSIETNTASEAGGGVFNNGMMTVSSSTLSRNQARSGGGIDHFGGHLTLTNDTLSGNAASDNGGGLYNRGPAILTHVTLSNNTANGPDTGGNIFNDTAQIALQSTIVANSEADGNCFNSDGLVTSSGHNLDSGSTCGFGSPGDLTVTDPLLAPLHGNGGQTLTHALLPGSPAIDRADRLQCPPMDQRGVSRPQGSSCDIGAYEAAASTRHLYLPLLVR